MKATLCNFPRSRSEHIIFALQIYHRKAISFDRNGKHRLGNAGYRRTVGDAGPYKVKNSTSPSGETSLTK